ncbi:hypothetical protein PMAYCL1PPCAC_15205, partial [Pristionchus mayeri]
VADFPFPFPNNETVLLVARCLSSGTRCPPSPRAGLGAASALPPGNARRVGRVLTVEIRPTLACGWAAGKGMADWIGRLTGGLAHCRALIPYLVRGAGGGLLGTSRRCDALVAAVADVTSCTLAATHLRARR